MQQRQKSASPDPDLYAVMIYLEVRLSPGTPAVDLQGLGPERSCFPTPISRFELNIRLHHSFSLLINRSNVHYIITTALYCPNLFGTVNTHHNVLVHGRHHHTLLHPLAHQVHFQCTSHTSGSFATLGKLCIGSMHATAKATGKIRGEFERSEASLSSANWAQDLVYLHRCRRSHWDHHRIHPPRLLDYPRIYVRSGCSSRRNRSHSSFSASCASCARAKEARGSLGELHTQGRVGKAEK